MINETQRLSNFLHIKNDLLYLLEEAICSSTIFSADYSKVTIADALEQLANFRKQLQKHQDSLDKLPEQIIKLIKKTFPQDEENKEQLVDVETIAPQLLKITARLKNAIKIFLEPFDIKNPNLTARKNLFSVSKAIFDITKLIDGEIQTYIYYKKEYKIQPRDTFKRLLATLQPLLDKHTQDTIANNNQSSNTADNHQPELPIEILQHIISFQIKSTSKDNNNFFRNTRVNKDWYRLHQDIKLWEKPCLDLVGELPPVDQSRLDAMTMAQWLQFCSVLKSPISSWHKLLFLVQYKKSADLQAMLQNENLIKDLKLSPLHINVIFENKELVSAFFQQKNTDENSFDCQGFTPLTWAAVSRNSEIFKIIFSKQSDRWMKNDQETMLELPSTKYHIQYIKSFVKNLTQREIDEIFQITFDRNYFAFKNFLIPYNYLDRNNNTVFHQEIIHASQESSVDLMHLLTSITDPNIINSQNSLGETPLMIAVNKGYEAVVYSLLNAKVVNINLTNNRGWTALFIAISQKNKKLVQKILDHKDLDETFCHPEEGTPLHFAIARGYDDQIISDLIKKFTINIKNKEGKTPLQSLLTKPQPEKHLSNIGWILRYMDANLELKDLEYLDKNHNNLLKDIKKNISEGLLKSITINLEETEYQFFDDHGSYIKIILATIKKLENILRYEASIMKNFGTIGNTPEWSSVVSKFKQHVWEKAKMFNEFTVEQDKILKEIFSLKCSRISFLESKYLVAFEGLKSAKNYLNEEKKTSPTNFS